MKTLYRGLILSVIFVLMTALGANADGIQINENISYNYQDNTFVVQQFAGSNDQELTVVLLKGEWSAEDLMSVTDEDFYYVGQKTASSYTEFGSLGIKYDGNKIEPGVYTLIISGDNASTKATKLVIGSAVNKDGSMSEHVHSGLSSQKVEFGNVNATFRVYSEDDYAYVCVSSFDYTSDGEMGFLFQRQNTDGEIQKAYKPISTMNTPLENIASISEGTKIQVGLQMNFVPKDVEFVAVPYIAG